MSQHQVSLKVLRLSSLDSGVDSLLQLPTSFGTIYQSEYFIALVSLRLEQDQDQSSFQVINPRLTIQFQSPDQLKTNQKTTLKTLNAQRLHPDSSQLDSIIQHQIHQLGLHSLICTVSYEEPILHDQNDLNYEQQSHHPILPNQPNIDQPQTQTRSFRKLYKFQALNPFIVDVTKIKLESRHDEKREKNDNHVKRLTKILNKLIIDKNQFKIKASYDQKDEQHLMPSSNDDDKIDFMKNSWNQIGVDDHDHYFLQVFIQNQALKPFDLNLRVFESELQSNSNHNNNLMQWKVIDLSHHLTPNQSSSLTKPTNIDTHRPSSRVDPEENQVVNLEESRKQEIPIRRISPGDVCQYIFKIKELAPSFKFENQGSLNIKAGIEDGNEGNNEKEEEEKELRLEINFTGVMGESGRLIKSLTQMIKSHSKQQGHLPHTSSPLPTSGGKIQYINSHPDLMMNDNHNKSRSNQLFRFEITQFPDPNSVKIGSKIHVKFKISIDLKDENDENLKENLVWILNSKLNCLNLTLPITNGFNKTTTETRTTQQVPGLILLNSLPLNPLPSQDISFAEECIEYQIDYQVVTLTIPVSHHPIHRNPRSFLDLGLVSTGSSDLDLLFNLPHPSIGSVFSSV